MIYTYECTNDGCLGPDGNRTVMEIEVSIKDDMRAVHPPCVQCGDSCNYKWVPYVPQFVLKDGATGSWPSKGNRFRQYRAKASEAAGKRQKDRYGDPKKALPNYKGEETGTWEEAKSQAIKDRGLEAAPTFDAKIAETKKDKLII
jgi:hypothetical protein